MLSITDKIKEQSQQLTPPELIKSYYSTQPKITYNTYQRNIIEARNAFLNFIAPNGNINEGLIYFLLLDVFDNAMYSKFTLS